MASLPPKILVSACLLGRPVRYDGSAKTLTSALLDHWQNEGRIIPACPEQMAGFSTPRPAAEIADHFSGDDVLAGRARVHDVTGEDVTADFITGAQQALALAQSHDCRFALLIDGSPSCGSLMVYDGSFTGHKHTGMGVTTALFRRNGIAVFAPAEIHDLHERLCRFPLR
ncbi:DUF523 domain-containing protein [Acetobacter indonesiensis]|uniref:Uncharacterized protein n=1 Tax=Acetobacter indonesiensis TaxID=104101 RepID=A0A252AT64_9PROT|nr:DUF523 domain-containing protein [Acetobacter indonesiensis]OUI93441.1 hypothetical protein HK17_07880 [Acetobacter indonesiensis]